MHLPVLVVRGDDAEPVSSAERLVVLLHGYNSSPGEIGQIAPVLDPDERWLIVALEGPVDLAGSGDERAWFTEDGHGPDPDSFGRAVTSVRETLQLIRVTHGLTVEKTVLVGYSQGGAIAVAATLGLSDRPVTPLLAVLSGFLTEADGHEWDWGKAASTRILIQHGTDDEVVPIDFARDLADLITMAGGAPAFESYAMGHERTDESLAALRAWIESDT